MKAMFCLAENQTVNQRPKERDSGGRTMGGGVNALDIGGEGLDISGR
jgi:hypothetical protein